LTAKNDFPGETQVHLALIQEHQRSLEVLLMKMSRIGVSVFGAALLFSASAFAGTTNKGSLHLEDDVTVDGTAVRPGTYTVEWDGSGPDVQVKLIKGHDTVATFPARLTEQNIAANANAYGSTDQPDGSKALTTIYFGGKHYALQVEPPNAQQQRQQSNTTPSK
jgi:hypothetical protein